MKPIKLTDAMSKKEIWVNPDQIEIVQSDKVGSLIKMRESVVLCTETPNTVIFRITGGAD
jgi:hypothetical protein